MLFFPAWSSWWFSLVLYCGLQVYKAFSFLLKWSVEFMKLHLSSFAYFLNFGHKQIILIQYCLLKSTLYILYPNCCVAFSGCGSCGAWKVLQWPSMGFWGLWKCWPRACSLCDCCMWPMGGHCPGTCGWRSVWIQGPLAEPLRNIPRVLEDKRAEPEKSTALKPWRLPSGSLADQRSLPKWGLESGLFLFLLVWNL